MLDYSFTLHPAPLVSLPRCLLCQITDAGLARLSTLHRLRSLNLTGLQVRWRWGGGGGGGGGGGAFFSVLSLLWALIDSVALLGSGQHGQVPGGQACLRYMHTLGGVRLCSHSHLNPLERYC